MAECANVDVPLDYEHPEGASLTLLLKRLVPIGNVTGQLWMFQGGPGGSSVDDFAALIDRTSQSRPHWAFYTIDHRGTGGSGRLGCTQEDDASEGGAAVTDAEWPDCVNELVAKRGAELPFMTTTNSARDLGRLIDRVRAPGKPVVVYGISYATYFLQRYLQLFPEQPTAVVLEGIATPSQGFDDYDADMNTAARSLMQACDVDATCSAKLGPDAWAQSAAIIRSFDSGQCPPLGLDTPSARIFFGSLLANAPLRDYVPALLFRVRRCTPADVTAVVHFYQVVAPLLGGGAIARPLPLAMPSGNDGKGLSQALFFHVALSEMWHVMGLPDPSVVEAAWSTTTMSTGLSVRLAKRQAGWPVYPRDELVGKWASYAGPLLMLQGRLDPATVYEAAAKLKAHFFAPHQTFVELPLGAHALRSHTPTVDGRDCAADVFEQFLDAPTAALDTSCTARMLPVQFSGAAVLNQTLFGTASAWD